MKKVILILTMLLAGLGPLAAQDETQGLAQSPVHRVQARQEPFWMDQPNGDSLQVMLVGDEAWHAYYTIDGYMVKQAKNNYWYYAKFSKKTYTDIRGHERHVIRKTCRRAKREEIRSAYEKRWLEKHIPNRYVYYVAPRIPNKLMGDEAAVQRILRKAPQQTMLLPPVGEKDLMPRVPVIMVEFADWSFDASTTREVVDSLYNGHNYHTILTGDYQPYSSVAQYFADQSMGAYRPKFDIIGPVKVAGKSTSYSTTSMLNNLLIQVCQTVDSEVDFSQYDADGDGKIDLVMLYYAGYGSNDQDFITDPLVTNPGSLIWPQMMVVGTSADLDGKALYKVEYCNELDGYLSNNAKDFGLGGRRVRAGIGVLCHEFGHGIGLPDVYNTQSGNWNFGKLDIMDYGSYNGEGYRPAGYTAYERWFCEWLEPEVIAKAEKNILPALSTKPQAYLLNEDGVCPEKANTEGTYYLLENRQKTGWDSSLPASGLLISRVQYVSSKWASNIVNNASSFKDRGLVIMSADGNEMVKYEKNCARVLYPYQGVDSFTLVEQYPIRSIRQEANGDITFSVSGSNPMGIEDATQEASSSKVLIDGRLVIVRGKDRYDVLGKRL